MDDRVECREAIGALDEADEPSNAVRPAALVDPSGKHKLGRLVLEVVFDSDRDEQRKANDEEQADVPDADKVVEARQKLFIAAANVVDGRKSNSDADVDEELHPAFIRAIPVRVKHDLHAQHKLGHECILRRRQRPPPKRIDPRTHVRGESPQRRLAQLRDPKGLPQRGGHAAAELAHGQGNAQVENGHDDEAPEHGDGPAVGEAAGEVLGLGGVGAQDAEGEGEHAPDVELAREGLAVAEGGEVDGIAGGLVDGVVEVVGVDELHHVGVFLGAAAAVAVAPVAGHDG